MRKLKGSFGELIDAKDGAYWRQPFLEWALLVLQQEGLTGWEIKPGEPYCWIEQKVIAFEGEDHVLFLHEVSHALQPEPEGPMRNHYHGGMWASKFAELIRKYMELKPSN